MRYSQNEFFKLVDAVEDQGGKLLPEIHENVYHTQFCGDKIKGEEVVYCGEEALLEIPYEGTDRNGVELGVQPIKVCAVDDMVGRWPRFAAAGAPGIA